jgi:hypothetical protein
MVWRRGDSSAVLRAFLDVVEEVDLLGAGERESDERAVLRVAGTET